MKQTSLGIAGTSLLVVAIGFGVSQGKDPQPAKKTDTPPAAVQPTPKGPAIAPADKPESKPAPDRVEQKAAKTGDAKTGDDRSEDEEAIRQTGDAFIKAYDEGDAKATAAQFTADAEYIDEQGESHQGREDIEEAMRICFARNPGGRVDMFIDSIKFVSPTVALEDGITTVTDSSGEFPVSSRYSAVHVKSDGKWQVASVREHAPKDRRQHRLQLRQLSWLLGEWVDEDRDSVVAFSCAATDHGNFLLRSFTIQIAGQEAMSGSQRIGWDPLTKKMRAWIFDSEGGYGEGTWSRDDDRWILKTTGVTADGRSASATTIYTMVNETTMTWQSVDLEIAGVKQPDSDKITIVRRAPAPNLGEETVQLNRK